MALILEWTSSEEREQLFTRPTVLLCPDGRQIRVAQWAPSIASDTLLTTEVSGPLCDAAGTLVRGFRMFDGRLLACPDAPLRTDVGTIIEVRVWAVRQTIEDIVVTVEGLLDFPPSQEKTAVSR